MPDADNYLFVIATLLLLIVTAPNMAIVRSHAKVEMPLLASSM
jgi:hypothetical protein